MEIKYPPPAAEILMYFNKSLVTFQAKVTNSKYVKDMLKSCNHLIPKVKFRQLKNWKREYMLNY